MSRRAPDWTRRASFDAHPVSASLARSFVVDQLERDELSQLVDPVRLVTSELATNAIVHARTPFTITLERIEDVVVLTVTDHSPRAPVRHAPGRTGSSGRGLDIVAMTSLDWGVDAGRDASKRVWASFSVDGHASP